MSEITHSNNLRYCQAVKYHSGRQPARRYSDTSSRQSPEMDQEKIQSVVDFPWMGLVLELSSSLSLFSVV